MSTSNDPRHRLDRARDRLTDDQEHILAFSKAIDPDSARAGPKKSERTVETYTNNLRRFEETTGASLTSMDLSAVLDGLEDLDVAASTLAQYQSAIKGFYRWSPDTDVDPEEIAVSTANGSPSIDPTTVLTGEEFHAIREAADNPRDRCIIDLFGYTGQRVRVIQTLRVKDVRPREGPTGRYQINRDVEGTKSVEKAMTNRPLLGAKRSVLDWLEYHPTGEPDDTLITTMPSTSRGTPGEQVSYDTLNRVLSDAADRAGVDKPVKPHAFRHFFATVAKTEYDMDDETIRRLLGHGPDSRIMETTYRHLSDDDVIADAEASFGADVEDGEASRAVPPTCRVCSEPLQPSWTRCPRCDEPYGAGGDRVSELEKKVEELRSLLD